MQVREALEQLHQRHLRLQPGQRRADADVRPAAEGDVRAVLAGDVEAVRVLEHRRIAVGGAQPDGHRLAGFQRAACDLHVARGQPRGDVDRRLVAQDLLDQGAGQLRVGLEFRQLLRVQQQQPHAVADQVGGGQVAANQQGPQVDAQLVVRQVDAGGLQLDHVADQVVAGVGPPVVDRRAEIDIQGLAGGHHRLGLGRGAERIEALDDAFGPATELGQPRGVDAKDRGDGVDRHGHAQAVHQVELGLAGDGVERLVDDPFDLRPELRHPRIERLGQRLAHAGVVGVIEHQDAGRAAARHGRVVTLEEPPLHDGRRVGLDWIAPQRPVADHGPDILVAAQHQAARHRVVLHRAAAAQVVEEHVRILVELGIERGELQDARRRL